MKKNNKLSIFGIILIYLLSVANVFNIFWSFYLVKEQMANGWGHGTNMDILVIVPWAIQLGCIPIFLLAVAYFIISYIFGVNKKLLVPNVVLFCALIIQSILINLFIWY